MKFQNEDLNYFDVEKFTANIFGDTQHKKRIGSIANAALGIISSGSLIVHRIGRGLASKLALSDKYAVKQVDRLLSNDKLVLEETDPQIVSYLIGERKEIKIAMDWTDFDHDNQASICLNLITVHGRATPLMWKTHDKNTLKDNRSNFEHTILRRLRAVIKSDVKVTIVADRGFFDIKLFEFIKEELNFDYCIRVRNNNLITDSNNNIQKVFDLIPANGRTKTLNNAKITAKKYEVPLIAIKQAQGMKQAWCIVSSDPSLSGSALISWYAKRWGCETQFRDTKDINFGMGLYSTHIKNADRRDRLLLINSIATIILTCLGAACEK